MKATKHHDLFAGLTGLVDGGADAKRQEAIWWNHVDRSNNLLQIRDGEAGYTLAREQCPLAPILATNEVGQTWGNQ